MDPSEEVNFDVNVLGFSPSELCQSTKHVKTYFHGQIVILDSIENALPPVAKWHSKVFQGQRPAD